MSIRGLSKVPKKELIVIQDELIELGKKLQKRRKELGFTQESFAEAMDVSANSVKYIEQGRRIPSLPMLMRLVRALKLKLTVEPRK
jgi:transcriptional regulator with XRE-family HTH domain